MADFTIDQKLIYNKFINRELQQKLVIINGTPGTGKSYLIREITSYMKKNQIPYHLLAYTNSAAVNIDGCTINKILKAGKNFCTDIENDSFNMKLFYSTKFYDIVNTLKIPLKTNLNYISSFKAKVGNFDLCDNKNRNFVVIIDELSMVPVSLFYTLLAQTNLRKCTFLMFGDCNQLQPISRIKRNVFECLKDIEEQDLLQFFELTTNIRHKDNVNFQKFIQNWYNDQISLDEYKNLASSFTFGGTQEEFYKLKFPKIVLCSTNQKAKEENEKLLSSIPGNLLISVWKITTGSDDEEIVIEDELIENRIKKETRLLPEVYVKKNIPVVLRINCDTFSLYNGSVHEFVDFTEEHAKIRVGSVVTSIKKHVENIDIDGVQYHVHQFPIGSFLTSTIHNIQGKTIDYPTLLCIDSVFDERLPYIALSRVTTPSLLYTDLTPIQVFEKWICKGEPTIVNSIEQILSRGVNRRQHNVSKKRKCKNCNLESIDYHVVMKKTKVNVTDEASGVDVVCNKCINLDP